jgi:D-cysteine desulfhydrase
MAVTALARFALGTLPTPLVRTERLEHALGCSSLLVKRDDLIGFALAGSKVRGLEFLMADALERRCSVLLTGGGAASSYCQGAAVAAAVAGLRCMLVMYGDEPAIAHSNLELARAAGAEVRFTGVTDRESVDRALPVAERELRTAGGNPYVVPRGGASAVAALGYAQAAAELDKQLNAVQVNAETVVVAVGSGVTYAGLLAGACLVKARWRLVGASVSRPQPDAAAQIRHLATECATLLGTPAPDSASIDVRDVRGPGYGQPSLDGERVARVALCEQGMVVDPVFTAKALALVSEMAREGVGGGPTVFWHTGGIPVALAHAVAAHQPL